MDKDYLREYQYKEIEFCKSLFQDESFMHAPISDRLRMIYGAPLDKEVIYCETGGIENLENYPEEMTVVLTVFPYKKKSLFEKHIGSFERFLEKSAGNKRIIPVVQSPLYYEKINYMEPLFSEIRAPSYFVRGQYAYATIMGEDNPELAQNRVGGSSLVSVVNLMDLCQRHHHKWLGCSVKDSDCWESKYRRIGSIGEHGVTRIRESLKYRYASVAYCLGKDVVDEIIETFDYKLASRILLHLHILFDHVIAHGFGSHLSVEQNSDEGRDFSESKFNIVRNTERLLCQNVEMLVPVEKDDYYRDLLKYEHPLAGIRLDSLKKSDMQEVSTRIQAQFENFRRKLQRLEKKKKITKRMFTISLFLLGSFVAQENLPLGAALAASGIEVKDFRVPEWLYEGTVGTLQRLYKHNLAFFLLNSCWNRNA